MKKLALTTAIVLAVLTSAFGASAALTPDPMVTNDLDALTLIDALPEEATGPSDTARDVFTAVNGTLEGVVPMMPLLRAENTIARAVLRLEAGSSVKTASLTR